MASKYKSSDDEEKLKCSSCQKRFSEVSKLPCEHSLCDVCLKKNTTKNRILCPLVKCKRVSLNKPVRVREATEHDKDIQNIKEYQKHLEEHEIDLRKKIKSIAEAVQNNNAETNKTLLRVEHLHIRRQEGLTKYFISLKTGIKEASEKFEKQMNNIAKSLDNIIIEIQKTSEQMKKHILSLNTRQNTEAIKGILSKKPPFPQKRVEMKPPSFQIEEGNLKIKDRINISAPEPKLVDIEVNIETYEQSEQMLLREVSEKMWIKQQDANLQNEPEALRVIRGRFWCCHAEGIMVYDSNLQLQRSLPRVTMDKVYDVAEINTGDIVVATKGGLWTLDYDDRRYIIDSGFFTSVLIHNKKLFAANGTSNQICIYQYNGTWSKETSHRMPFHLTGHTITLSIQNNHVRCYSAGDNQIHVLSMKEKQLHTYGGHGNIVGQFCSPYIGDDDDDGSMLIADWGKDRLQVMEKNGLCSLVQLQPAVSMPRSAALYGNTLYVISRDKKLLI